MKNQLLERFLVHGEIESIEQVTRRMRRIRLAGPAIGELAWVPGQQIRVYVGELTALRSWREGLLRTYSVWERAAETLDLCVFDHGGDGPGARWSRETKVGQPVLFTKPEGRLVTRPAEYHVFAGEETASVAFGPMLRALPADARIHGVVEVDSAEGQLPLPDQIDWRYREGRSAASSTALVAAVAALPLPDEPGVAYVAGEARTIQAVRDQLVRDRGWPRQSVITKPFWTPGKRGLD
ncbi:MAG TPA: siderophore-interacting protein [Pseudonocardiaceae bacterium]|jgi:NADPH-dependent ferric siderophore reductase|nr:siderophore-interacting protein [Pseudonocardiaceae bacterium]